ncbi:MAG: hypothetical protein Aurels2KO_39620 [Aureliella sp.]
MFELEWLRNGGVARTFRYVPHPLLVQPVTDDQALFIACLPDTPCDIDYAIRAHPFMQRVAAVTPEFARDAIRIAAACCFVDTDDSGKVRLSLDLQSEREALTESEGYVEVAQRELADLLVQRSRRSGGT